MLRTFRVLIILTFLSSTSFAQDDRKRVAVLDFDYGTVRNVVQAYFGTDQDVGKGISLLLEQKLVQDGKYRVIDRNTMDKILKEQNFSNSDRVDAATAAKIGHILGVSCIIVGSITQFGRDDKHVGGGAAAYGLGKFGLGGLHKNDSKAVVNVTAKMVDADSAEILAVVTGTGESKRSGFAVGGGGGDGSGGGGGAVDMGSSNFANTILGEAVHAAVDNMGQQLDAKAASLPTVKVTYTALVADVTGNTLILNIGSKAGVKAGDQVSISRKVKDVKDPTSGAVIKTITDQLGTATVTEVDDSSATATFSGSTPPKVGDVAKSQ